MLAAVLPALCLLAALLVLRAFRNRVKAKTRPVWNQEQPHMMALPAGAGPPASPDAPTEQIVLDESVKAPRRDGEEVADPLQPLREVVRDPAATGRDRRAQPRIACGSRGYAYCFDECRPVHVRDVTAEGIGLWCAQPLLRGAWLVLVLPVIARNIQGHFRARVEYAAEYPEGGWVIGCTFLQELAPGELESLLDAGAVA